MRPPRMSLIPKLVAQMWEQMERPHRLFDQHFGVGLNHHQTSWPPSFFTPYERRLFRELESPYFRPWSSGYRDAEPERGWSDIREDKDKFQVALDVQQFRPEEISVKVVDNYVVVEGKHEEQSDEHGTISRHFVRKYLIPDQCDPEQATSTLSSDGVLNVTAPRRPEAAEPKHEKVLKVEKTGKPALQTGDKGDAAAKPSQPADQKVAHSQ